MTPLPRIGYVVHGRGGLHPATAHIRVTRRLNRAVVDGRAQSLQIDPVRFADGDVPDDLDVVLVQRDAVPAEIVERFLARVRERGLRLVADVDDDFFGAEARARLMRAEYDPSRLAAVEAMVRAADEVLVSTPVLRRIVRAHTRGHVTVVPNALDAEFWVDPVEVLPALDDGVVRVLFQGSTTHGDDLAMLQDAFVPGLQAADGRTVRLEVIGIDDRPDAAWYDRLPIPDGWTHYPEYVRWLRSQSARWSVAVALLTDDGFNRAKSDIKALDAALLSLPVVASAGPQYRHLGRRGVRLVRGNTPAAWRRAIVDAIGDDRAARRLREFVLANRTLSVTPEWLDAVVGRAR